MNAFLFIFFFSSNIRSNFLEYLRNYKNGYEKL